MTPATSGGAVPAAGEGGGGAPALHASLARPRLLAGVERPVFIAEGMIVLHLFSSLGFRLATFGIAAVVAFVVHPTLARLTAAEPMLTEIYGRYVSRWRQRVYPAHPGLAARGGKLPTLPFRITG